MNGRRQPTPTGCKPLDGTDDIYQIHPMDAISRELYEAAWTGDLGQIRAIVARKDILPERALDSALEAAAYNAKPDALELLLSLGADARTVHLPTGESILHQAITKTSHAAERTRIVELLIANGAEVNCRTVPGAETLCFMRDIRTRGETPLHRAAAYGDIGMIRALIDAGADKSARDAHGESPLTWASWHLREREVILLLLFGEFEGSLS